MSETIKDDPLMKDGKLHQFTLKLKGKRYFCECGCNVFHKPDKSRLDVFRCNSCSDTFATE